MVPPRHTLAGRHLTTRSLAALVLGLGLGLLLHRSAGEAEGDAVLAPSRGDGGRGPGLGEQGGGLWGVGCGHADPASI